LLSHSPASQFDVGHDFVLWLSVPIAVRTERAGHKKVYLSFTREPIFELAETQEEAAGSVA